MLARGRVAYAPPAEAGTDGVSGRGGGGQCVFWVESEPLSDASLTRPTAFSCAAVSVWVFPLSALATHHWRLAVRIVCDLRRPPRLAPATAPSDLPHPGVACNPPAVPLFC